MAHVLLKIVLAVLETGFLIWAIGAFSDDD